MFQARLSINYLLVVREEPDRSWTLQVVGPCPIEVPDPFIEGLEEAQRAAYSLGRKHFIGRGVADVPVEFADLRWVAYPL